MTPPRLLLCLLTPALTLAPRPCPRPCPRPFAVPPRPHIYIHPRPRPLALNLCSLCIHNAPQATSLLVRVHSKQRLLSRPLDDAADDAAAAADDAEGGGGAGDDGAGDGGAPRRRRARLSVEDRAAGLNALLAEMDVTKPSAAALPIS